MKFTVSGIYRDNDQAWSGVVEAPENATPVDILKLAYRQLLKDNRFTTEDEEDLEDTTERAKANGLFPLVRFTDIIKGEPEYYWLSDYYED